MPPLPVADGPGIPPLFENQVPQNRPPRSYTSPLFWEFPCRTKFIFSKLNFRVWLLPLRILFQCKSLMRIKDRTRTKTVQRWKKYAPQAKNLRFRVFYTRGISWERGNFLRDPKLIHPASPPDQKTPPSFGGCTPFWSCPSLLSKTKIINIFMYTCIWGDQKIFIFEPLKKSPPAMKKGLKFFACGTLLF